MLEVQTPNTVVGGLLVCFIMNCDRYVQREDSLSFVFLIFTVSKFSNIKKRKSKPEVFARENFSTHVAHLHREFYLKIGLIFKSLKIITFTKES